MLPLTAEVLSFLPRASKHCIDEPISPARSRFPMIASAVKGRAGQHRLSHAPVCLIRLLNTLWKPQAHKMLDGPLALSCFAGKQRLRERASANFRRALAFLRPGDTLVVWKLDRLGRSLKDLIETLNLLSERGADFLSLTENIDTSTPGGKLIFHLMGALAEFERDLIRERTLAGLAAARARGRVGGRPRRISEGKVALAQQLYLASRHSVSEICSMLEISRSTFFRYVREGKNKPGTQA